MKLINESQRFQKLAGMLNENQDVEEGIGKAIGTAVLGAALALGSPEKGIAQTRPSMEQSIEQMTNKNLADMVIKAYEKSPDAAAKWNKKFKRHHILLRSIVDVIEEVIANKKESDPTTMEQIGKYLKKYPETTQEFLDAMNKVQESIDLESMIGEVLTQLRESEEETSSEEELTPDQINVIKNIVKLSEAAEGENKDDKAKFEKLKSELAKATLTAAFVATLITSMSSCRTSGYGCHGRESWKQMVKRNGGGGW